MFTPPTLPLKPILYWRTRGGGLGPSFQELPNRGRRKPASSEFARTVEVERPQPGGGAGALT